MAGSKAYGVELDSISGRIAGQLYQNASISVNGFETVQMPDSFFDVAVGNVPFGDFKVLDKRYDKHHWLIHDYFFGKTLVTSVPAFRLKVLSGRRMAPMRSARWARYLRTAEFSLSSVPFDVMNATIPPGRTLSSVFPKK